MSKEIATQSVPAAEARQRLGQIMRQMYNREVRVIVEKGGIPVVAVVSLSDFERWTRLDREREERYRVIDEIRSRNLSNASRTLYVGVTDDLQRRVYEHKQKFTHGFTRKYNLTLLVYFETTPDILAAIAREKQIKGWLRAKKLSLIESVNPKWLDLSAQWQ